MKPHITVITEKPLVVVITKKGRAVSATSAQAALKKVYPTKQFVISFSLNGHSTSAKEIHND